MGAGGSARVGWFNDLGTAEAEALLLSCCASPAWAATVLRGRPYADEVELLRVAATAADRLSSAAVGRALAAHPRIGHVPQGTAPQDAWSRREQAGVATDGATRRALVVGNAAYERRFGRVFLIAARGLDTQEILGALERRLRNDPVSEHREVVAALRAIATQRLDEALHAGAGSDRGAGRETS
ncbi:2-oxo-4-hydroxy-4-carboxy-5-ureidoimidazoline decarboxylase [Nocardioides sp. AN3]